MWRIGKYVVRIGRFAGKIGWGELADLWADLPRMNGKLLHLCLRKHLPRDAVRGKMPRVTKMAD